MKKATVLFLLTMFAFCGLASARTTYDSNGAILHDGTIRGQKRAQLKQAEEQRKLEKIAAENKLKAETENKQNETLVQNEATSSDEVLANVQDEVDMKEVAAAAKINYNYKVQPSKSLEQEPKKMLPNYYQNRYESIVKGNN